MNELKAPSGYYYTQAGDVTAEERIFADIIYLANNDRAENWRLATAEEKAAFEAENE